MRLFLALEIEEEAKKAVFACQEKGKTSLTRGIKWVEPENFHVTLVFLGDKEPDLLPAIIKAVSSVIGFQCMFNAELKGVGLFPGLRNPRVIWMGINNGAKKIIDLSRALEKELNKVTPLKSNSKNTPHITLGRVKNNIDQHQLKAFLDSYGEKVFASFRAKNTILYESVLTREGPDYKQVKNFNFKKGF